MNHHQTKSQYREKEVKKSLGLQDKDKKYNLSDVLKVSAQSQDIDNSLRQKQLGIFRLDKRMREREGIEPNRRTSKRTRRYKHL
jgi:hypothetical protein